MGNEVASGTVEINMAPYVGEGPVFQVFDILDQSVTRNAKVNAFFTIYEDGKQPNDRFSDNPALERK